MTDNIIQLPKKPAGYWRVTSEPNVDLAVYTRPRLMTRLMCHWLLEWKWIPAEKWEYKND